MYSVEYDAKTENFNVGTVYINGRFPTEKCVVSLELEEIYYVALVITCSPAFDPKQHKIVD